MSPLGCIKSVLPPDNNDNDKLPYWEEVNVLNTNTIKIDNPTADCPEGDTDADGLPNWYERKYCTQTPVTITWMDPDADFDEDGFINVEEGNVYGTDPLNPDTDQDEYDDKYEFETTYAYSEIDWNGDGIIDYKTNPLNPDTDFDGLKDYEEVNTFQTATFTSSDHPKIKDKYLAKAYINNVIVSGDTDSVTAKMYLTHLSLEDLEIILQYQTGPGSWEGKVLYWKGEYTNYAAEVDLLQAGFSKDLFETYNNWELVVYDKEENGKEGFIQYFTIEIEGKTSPLNPDTDFDGLTDGEEITTLHTSTFYCLDQLKIKDNKYISPYIYNLKVYGEIVYAIANIKIKHERIGDLTIDVGRWFDSVGSSTKIWDREDDGGTTINIERDLLNTHSDITDIATPFEKSDFQSGYRWDLWIGDHADGKEGEMTDFHIKVMGKTSPLVSDMDNDGFLDGEEVNMGTELLSQKKWGIFVGCSNYAGTQNDLDYTDDDAKNFFNDFVEWHWVNEPKCLINIRWSTLKDSFEISTDEDDIVVFYFSGHGEKNKIIVSDGNNNDYVSEKDLNKKLNQIKCDKMIIILDTCNSGSLSDPLKNPSDNQNRRLLITACQSDEYSHEDDELENGVFTYFYLQNADAHNGYCTLLTNFDGVKDLTNDYVEDYCSTWLTTYHQHPQYWGEDIDIRG